MADLCPVREDEYVSVKEAEEILEKHPNINKRVGKAALYKRIESGHYSKVPAAPKGSILLLEVLNAFQGPEARVLAPRFVMAAWPPSSHFNKGQSVEVTYRWHEDHDHER